MSTSSTPAATPTDQAVASAPGAVARMTVPTLTAMVVGGWWERACSRSRHGSGSPPGSSAR